MKQDLYDVSFDLYSVVSNVIDLNGDAEVEKNYITSMPCQIDNLNGNDAVRYGKNNELATHVVFCDLIDYTNINTACELVCQNKQLDISFIARNEGGLTDLTHGLEIYCIMRGWVDTDMAIPNVSTFYYISSNTSTDENLTSLYINGTSRKIIVPLNKTWSFRILIAARQVSGLGNLNDSAGYIVTGVIKNSNGGTTLPSIPTVTVIGEDIIDWDIRVSADDSDDSLSIQVLGEAGKVINWKAKTEIVEIS